VNGILQGSEPKRGRGVRREIKKFTFFDVNTTVGCEAIFRKGKLKGRSVQSRKANSDVVCVGTSFKSTPRETNTH